MGDTYGTPAASPPAAGSDHGADPVPALAGVRQLVDQLLAELRAGQVLLLCQADVPAPLRRDVASLLLNAREQLDDARDLLSRQPAPADPAQPALLAPDLTLSSWDRP